LNQLVSASGIFDFFTVSSMVAQKHSSEFLKYPNLASSELGTRILFTTDDFFAVAENLISPTEPKFDINAYTVHGKELDGWETRRKRTIGHDWLILALGKDGQIIGFDVDTLFFTGNYVPAVSIQGVYAPGLTLNRRSEIGTKCTEQELKEAEMLKSNEWKTILEMQPLSAGVPETRHHYFDCLDTVGKYTHLRVNLYPDGGIARLRVYGIVTPDFNLLKSPCDLALVENGGRAISWSNSHYGTPMQLLKTLRSTGMHDGWETGILY
jgi:allantoicase